jgi:hypothetical protein
MSSVSSSLNPGVADLFQTLTNLGSSVLNSASVKSALEKAPASDIVELSTEATQLANVDTLFGIGSSSSSTSATTSILQALEPSTSTSSTSSTATETPAEQAASAQALADSELTQGLFGTGTNNSLPGSIFNMLG